MQEVTVGSSAQCDVNIANDFVSRRHCKLVYTSEGVWIEDLDSSNGTYVDGESIPQGRRVKIDVTSDVSLAQEVPLGWREIESFRPEPGQSVGKEGTAKETQDTGRDVKKDGRPGENKGSAREEKRSKKQSSGSGHAPIPKENRKSLQEDTSSSSKGSIVGAIFTMILVSLLLFWLPFIGPVIAGYVGGKKAGGVGKAIVATLLPGVVAGVLVFSLAGSISGIPVLGAILGAGATVLILSHVGPLLLGAILGGAVA